MTSEAYPALKRCNICGETKGLTAFWTDQRKPDGRQTRCADCANRRRAQTKLDGVPDRGPMYVEEDRGYTTPCWIWQRAKTNRGYGAIRRDGRNHSAHRWVYEQHGGTYPEGKPFLDHLCRVPVCVNPAHLEPVTNRENIRRGLVLKLSDADVLAIRASHETGPVLALRYGVGTNYIYAIKAGECRADAA